MGSQLSLVRLQEVLRHCRSSGLRNYTSYIPLGLSNIWMSPRLAHEKTMYAHYSPWDITRIFPMQVSSHKLWPKEVGLSQYWSAMSVVSQWCNFQIGVIVLEYLTVKSTQVTIKWVMQNKQHCAYLYYFGYFPSVQSERDFMVVPMFMYFATMHASDVGTLHVHVCAHVCLHAYRHACVHERMCICTHICAYICSASCLGKLEITCKLVPLIETMIFLLDYFISYGVTEEPSTRSFLMHQIKHAWCWWSLATLCISPTLQAAPPAIPANSKCWDPGDMRGWDPHLNI